VGAGDTVDDEELVSAQIMTASAAARTRAAIVRRTRRRFFGAGKDSIVEAGDSVPVVVTMTPWVGLLAKCTVGLISVGRTTRDVSSDTTERAVAALLRVEWPSRQPDRLVSWDDRERAASQVVRNLIAGRSTRLSAFASCSQRFTARSQNAETRL